MEEDIIRFSQLNSIKKELLDSTYEEFIDPTLWSVYNIITHSLKNTRVDIFTEKHRALENFRVLLF